MMKPCASWLSVNKQRRCCRLSDEGLEIAKDDEFRNVCCHLPRAEIMCSHSLGNGELQLVIKNSPVIHIRAASDEEIEPFVHAFDGIGLSRKTGDDYEVIEALGCGYFGKVYLVAEKETGRQFAMKRIPKRRLITSSEIRRTIHERNVLLQSSHPFSPRLHETFHDQENLCLILDYAEGGDLEHCLERGVSYPADQIRIYIAEIATTLAYLHSLGVVFRDLKPANVLICEDGHLMLTDFGLAKDLTEDSTTGSFCGTHEYLAPEVVAGKTYSYAIDWWALGVIAFRLLTGYLPFKSANLSRLYDMIVNREAKYPKKMDEVTKSFLQGLLVKDPLRRMGDEEVLRHPFFAKIDWNMLNEKKYDIRVKPELVGKQTLPSE